MQSSSTEAHSQRYRYTYLWTNQNRAMRFQPKPRRTRSIAVAFILTIFALMLSSCEQDKEPAPVQHKQGTSEQLSFLVNSGFDAEEIRLEDGIFIIDDDILISQTDVDGYIAREKESGQGRTEHYRGPYLVSDNHVTNIRFYISSSVPSSWATAIRGAINQWNAVNGTKLYMSESTSSSSAHTVINTSYSSQNWVARAYLPSYNRRPGHTMTINTRYNGLSSGYKLFTIVHEMGHVFGLYHSDQKQGTFIQGTPTTDPNSVMNSYVLPWNGFTQGDIRAVQILYPQ